jgi:hypothetical protein
MDYTLKDKLIITKDFLKDLEEKSWQEIEHIQHQLTNIDEKPENAGLIKLLKNLLTSHYIFTGGLENLESEAYTSGISNKIDDKKEAVPEVDKTTDEDCLADIAFDEPAAKTSEPVSDYVEPFEYFVDFDDPIGEPLTDEDLYNN